MQRYPSLSAVPALPVSAADAIEYLAHSQVIRISYAEPGYWIINTEESDGREAYLRGSGEDWGIQVSGATTADAFGVTSWREAIGRFF